MTRTRESASNRQTQTQVIFRRAKPDDAVELALATFQSGARVDMQALAAQLDVAPATMTRWFGSRAQLLDRVLERLAIGFTDAARREAQGTGNELVCDLVRRVMETSVESEPIRAFVQREPQLALRLILGEAGAVHRVLADALRSVFRETRSAEEADALESRIDVIVQVGTALQWATFAIGDEPRIDSVIDIIRLVLAASRGTS